MSMKLFSIQQDQPLNWLDIPILTDHKRTPEDIVYTISFFASEAAQHVTRQTSIPVMGCSCPNLGRGSMAHLKPSEVDSYRNQGYLLRRQAIKPPDLASVRTLIMVLVDRHASQLYQEGKISCLYEDEPFERRLALINHQAELGASLWDLAQAFDCPELFHLIRHPAILDSLESLLGTEISWTGSYVTRPKLPRNEGTVWPWHQDSQYYGQATQHLHVVSLWIPLVEVNEDNGCLYIIPGSHNWSLLKGQRETDNKVHTLEEVEQRGKPVALPMKQGDILLFSNLTFHASKLNTSSSVRWSVDLRYMASPQAQRQTEQQRQGYDSLKTHYRVEPITVRSRQPEKVANLPQLQAFARHYSALRSTANKNP